VNYGISLACSIFSSSSLFSFIEGSSPLFSSLIVYCFGKLTAPMEKGTAAGVFD